MKGINDLSKSNIQEDRLCMAPFVEGLAEYIKECETPMAIAIQGGWGTGKTTIMQMVQDELNHCADKNGKLLYKCITFNPWTVSQFQMGDAISISFLKDMLNGMLPDDQKHKENATKIKKIISNIAVGTTKKFAGDLVGEVLDKTIQASVDWEKENDFSEQMKELILSFHKIVDETNVDRLVFFVDDMDRIKPSLAVELLELLKILFDHPKCIFLLSVDADVVHLGIKEKYGNNISEEKAKAFFDKLIQLPFVIPVLQYKTDAFFEELLPAEIRDSLKGRDREWVRKILFLFTKGSPRMIKRFSNALLLQNNISRYKVQKSTGMWFDESEDQRFRSKYLIYSTALSLCYPFIYSQFVMLISYSFISRFLESDMEIYIEKMDTENFAHLLRQLGFYGFEMEDDTIIKVFEVMYELFNEYVDCNVGGEYYPFLRIERLAYFLDESGREPGIQEEDVKPYFEWVDRILSVHYYRVINGINDPWLLGDTEYSYYLSREDAQNNKDGYLFRLCFDDMNHQTYIKINDNLEDIFDVEEYSILQMYLQLMDKNLNFFWNKLIENEIVSKHDNLKCGANSYVIDGNEVLAREVIQNMINIKIELSNSGYFDS